MSHIFQRVERGSFQHILPSVLALKCPASDLIVGKNGKKQKAYGNENNTESKCVMNDFMVAEEWKLSKDEENRFREFLTPK